MKPQKTLHNIFSLLSGVYRVVNAPKMAILGAHNNMYYVVFANKSIFTKNAITQPFVMLGTWDFTWE